LKGWLILGAVIAFAVVIPLGAWISGLRLAIPPNPMSTDAVPPMGEGNPKDVQPPSDTDRFHACDATALSGTALLLKCADQSAVVVLDAVHTLPPGKPLGDAAMKAIASATGGFPVDCRPGHFGWTCTVQGVDLANVLIAAGLGVTDDPSRLDLELRALLTGQGLWWDWPVPHEASRLPAAAVRPPPAASALTRWRVDKDEMIGQFEVAQAGRAQAFASFFSGVTAFVVGGLLAYILNEHRADKRSRSQKEAVVSFLSQTKRDLSMQVNVIKTKCSQSDIGLSSLLSEWGPFDEMYTKYDNDCNLIRLNVLQGNGGDIDFVDLSHLLKFLLKIKPLHGALTSLLGRYSPDSEMSAENFAYLRQQIIHHITAYQMEDGLAHA